MSVVAHLSRWRFSAVGGSGTTERPSVFLSERGGTCCGALSACNCYLQQLQAADTGLGEKVRKSLQEHPTGESL